MRDRRHASSFEDFFVPDAGPLKKQRSAQSAARLNDEPPSSYEPEIRHCAALESRIESVLKDDGFLAIENDPHGLGFYQHVEVWVMPIPQSGVQVAIRRILTGPVGANEASRTLSAICCPDLEGPFSRDGQPV